MLEDIARESVQSSLPEIGQVFARMRDQGGWDVASPMLWGYFFTSFSPTRLEAAARHLSSLGYRRVDVYEAELDTDGEAPASPLFFLHLERVELHTPPSLHARNIELNALATELDLTSYDGWDVGLAPKPSKVDSM